MNSSRKKKHKWGLPVFFLNIAHSMCPSYPSYPSMRSERERNDPLKRKTRENFVAEIHFNHGCRTLTRMKCAQQLYKGAWNMKDITSKGIN